MSVCLPSCGWLLSSLILASSRRIASVAPVMALTPSQGRAEWQGEPFTVTNTSMRPRLPSVIFEPGAAEHRHVGAHAGAFDHALDGVVLAGLARQAAGEDRACRRSAAARDHGFHGVQHGGQVGLLLARALAHDALAGQAVLRAVDDVAVIGIGHGRRRLVHGVADEHQRFAAGARAVGRDQVAHGVVADVGKAHGAQARLDRRLDEVLEQRLVLEQLGLRARHLDELDQQLLRALARDAWRPAVS